MAKQCPRCGYLNPDTANFCSNCGYPLPLTSSPQPNLPPPTQRDRLSEAFNIFTKNLGMVVPSIILLIVEIVLAVIFSVLTLGIFFVSPIASIILAVIFAIIMGLISAILFSVVVHTTMYMASDASNNLPINASNSFSRARSTLSHLYSIVGILILLGILGGLSRSSAVVWFLVGLVGILLYIMSASVVLGKPMSLTSSIDWYIKAFNRDAGSAIVIF
ncbi:zinc ribbon domain-containing protein, partial [Sulfolobus sp. A20-N-F8]